MVKSVPLVCSGHTRPVVHLNDDDSYMLISSCKDGQPMLRDWTGDWVGTFLGHKGAVWQSKLSADTARAATASADFTAKIFNTYTGAPVHSFSHSHIVRTVALSPPHTSAPYLLTGGHEGLIRIFDLDKPEVVPLVMEGPKGKGLGVIRSVVWGEEDGNVAVSAGEEGIVRFWDLRTLSQTAELNLGEPITSMELNHGGGTLCVTSGKKVTFLDIARRDPPLSLTLPHALTSVSLHPITRDRFIAGSLNDPWVRIYSLGTGKEIGEPLKGHHGPVHCVSYSPDGECYASGSEDGTVRLWQDKPGKPYGLWNGTFDQ